MSSSEKQSLLNDFQVQAIYHLALEAAPKECCGFITENGQVVPIENISPNAFTFRMEPNAMIMAMKYKQTKYIFHSHVYDGPDPSPMDRAIGVQDHYQVILSVAEKRLCVYTPWDLIQEIAVLT